MKKLWKKNRQTLALFQSNKEKGIVIPAILWILGVPLSLIIILWLLGVF